MFSLRPHFSLSGLAGSFSAEEVLTDGTVCSLRLLWKVVTQAAAAALTADSHVKLPDRVSSQGEHYFIFEFNMITLTVVGYFRNTALSWTPSFICPGYGRWMLHASNIGRGYGSSVLVHGRWEAQDSVQMYSSNLSPGK